MSIPTPLALTRRFSTLALAAVITLAFGTPAPAIDLNSNGVSDVWEDLYPGAADPNGDSNGNGVSNVRESIFGTNPLAPGGQSVNPTISYNKVTNSLSISWPTVLGKRYQLRSSPNMSAGSWTNDGAAMDGTGGTLSVSRAKGSAKFYCVQVSDKDGNGDGLSDWEALALGLNPAMLDSNGDGINDAAWVTAQLQAPNIVSIHATKSLASEDGPDPGTFTVKRTRSLQPVTVSYTVAGTAVPGTDYATLPGSVVIPAGVDSAVINVNPAQDPSVKGSRSVTATLQSSQVFAMGAPNSATVIIKDSTAPTGTGLLGRYYDTSSTTYSNPANFDPAQLKLTRVDPTVNFSWLYGTPNDATIVPNSPVDNISAAWEGYLSLGTAASVRFQLDADDKARVLLDLDRNGTFEPGEVVVEHGWVTTGTVGQFKVSSAQALAATPTAGERYRIRVEHVDASGDARCRLQWSLNGATFANIPSGNIFSHTQAATYAFTRANAATGTATITLTGHVLAAGSPVKVAFSSGNLFTPNASDLGGYSGNFLVMNPTANTFQVAIAGTNLPANVGAGAICIVEDRPGSTTGWMTRMYTNTTLSNAPGFVGTGTSGPTTLNNGIWGLGAPDPSMGKDTFSVRWTGQMQPQYSETYTLAVTADDACALKIAGQAVPLRLASSSVQTGTYSYDAGSGNVVFNFSNTIIQPGAFTAGEKVRLDPTSGNLNFASVTCTYAYDGTTGDATINYTALANAPVGKFSVGETVYLDPTSGNLTSLASLPYLVTAVGTGKSFTVNFGTGTFATGSGNVVISNTYNYDSATGIAVIDYSNLPNLTATGFSVGETVLLDPTTGSLSALATLPYVITATGPGKTFTVNLGQNLGASGAGAVTISDNRDLAITAATPTTFTVNFGAGKAATGNGNMTVDALNRPIKDWTVTTAERYARLPMAGGARYDIQLDYFENTGSAGCVLSWYSPSQARQVIPASRLYPASAPQAPAAHVSAMDATALVGGPFSYQILGSNGGTISVSGNPAWLTLSGNVLSGTPPPGVGGEFQVTITITNGVGTSTSVLNVRVDDTVGSVVREHWNGVAGTTVASIPVGTPATGTSSLTSLAGPTDFGDNYGARIRGYITAPVTGNYYFWIAANNAAELWISNDKEPVNAFKRAWVNVGSAISQTWNAEPNQKSGWLALEQGKKYYIEVLHKAGVGLGDNLAVGWLKPGQTGDAPSEVVPGYALSPYVPPAPGSTPGTLYVATMLSQAGALTNGVGTATLRLSEDETVAYLRWTSNGLTGPITDWHIHSDPFLSHPSAIIYDGAEPLAGDGPQPDGSHKWNIIPSGTLTLAEVRELIKQGRAYLNLHTAAYPNGEIRGNFALAEGSRTFSPPPAPPAWTDDSNTANGAVRFLTQATFGGSAADVQALRAIVPTGGKTRYEAWIEAEFAKPASQQLPEVIAYESANRLAPFADSLTYNAWWKNSMTGSDQLRQRVAFALSQIHVVSTAAPLQNNARAVSYFYDKLADNAFGNFRQILEDTTLTPTMGRYLDMLRNDKPDQGIGRIPNENYAREIKQLFSIGLFRMWPDGSLVLNSEDEVIPTYTQNEIVGISHVFTGWDYGYDGPFRTTFSAATNWTRQMREVPGRHYVGQKRILDNEVLPGLEGVDPYAAHIAVNFDDPAYRALPRGELDAVHDQLFNHPNTGPFICRQLIQRMVTSHPTRDYLYRVAQKFNNNGSGVRGDMQAVIKAILLDFEARSAGESVKSDYGKQREPVMRIAQAARAFRPSVVTGTYSQVSTGTSSRTITVNTAAPHRLNNGNSVFLEFGGGSPAPHSGIYPVAAITGSQNTSTRFTVNATGWAAGTYSQATGSSSMTITISGHWLAAGHKCYLDFQTGAADGIVGLDNAIHTVATSSGETSNNFTIAVPAAASARSGNVIMPRFTPGSYQSSSSGMAAPNDRRVRLNTNQSHHLNVGDPIFLNFSGPSNGTIPTDGQFVVESVVDNTTFTVLGSSASGLTTNLNDNGIWMFPLLPQPRDRSGPMSTRSSTFALGSTNGDIAQTPLNSPTVFNYFSPDFKFPGALASQAITTPEFQLTSDTNVVRQTNFIFNGVFNPGNTNGISSFRSGSNALVMDFGPWMGNAVDINGLGAGPQTGQAWTSNANLGTLIDRMNTLLLAGQLSSSGPTSGKTIIQNFVSNTTNVPYTDGSPTDTQKRDRIRSIIHLIITSADYTIQR